MAMVEPTDPNEASNYRMGRNPIVGEPQGGEMLKPTLPEGILPLYLAKVHPEAMAAAGAAGAEAVAAMPLPVQEVANVDLPREDAAAPPLEGQQPLPPWETPQAPQYQPPAPNQPPQMGRPAPPYQAPTSYQPPR